jgi:hypothetical protein
MMNNLFYLIINDIGGNVSLELADHWFVYCEPDGSNPDS